jgi:hypothetical protein
MIKKYYMHLMILWNSAQTSKEIRKYLTIVNIFVYYNAILRIWTNSRVFITIRNYDTQLFQNISYFELLVNQFR